MNQLIESLIEKKYEGDYWDFKQTHHDNKASLLHDILCMHNCLSNGDRYIIFGVSDPSSDCEIIGLKDDNNRRTQCDIISILSSTSFAGDIRPNIELKKLIINQCEVDILIIKKSDLLPIFLTSDYRDRSKVVRANYIYTRTQDRNTPINESADLYLIEKMWKVRFGIDKTPSEKLLDLLDDYNNWSIDLGNKDLAYHNQYPEYKIELGEPSEFYEPFCGSYLNETAYKGSLRIMYNSTELFGSEYWTMDEMRLYLPKADINRLDISTKSVFYNYCLDEIEGKLLKLFTKGSMNLKSRKFGGSQFIIFDNKNEKLKFINDAKSNYHRIEEMESYFDADCALKMQKEKNKFANIDPVVTGKIKRYFEEWKYQQTNQ